MKIAFQIGILVVFISFSLSTIAAPVHTETSAAGNTYISGGNLKIATPVQADLLAAGGRVSVEREVGADAAVAGGTVDVRAPIKQDLRVAGGTVNLGADIGGELVAAGGTVRVEDTVTVAGTAWLAGGEVVLAGSVGQGAKIYANTITLSGKINGNTRLYAQEINLLPQARINGDLVYASANPLRPEQAAQVLGTVTREPLPKGWDEKQNKKRSLPWFSAFFILSMLAAGVLLYLLFPNAVAGTQRAIGQHPLRSLLIGLALLFTVPPLAIMFMVTVIGIPIGFILLLLYPLMLFLGYLGAAFFISRVAANALKQPQQLNLGRQCLFLVLALILLSMVAWIPFLGGLILIAAWVTGIGGWAVWMHAHYSANEVSTNG